jgi:predicted P-loop ATPase
VGKILGISRAQWRLSAPEPGPQKNPARPASELRGAVHYYRSKDQATRQWWPDREFEQKTIEPEQTDRTEVDSWFEDIADYIKGKAEVYMLGVLRDGLGFDVSRIDPVHSRRVAAMLWQLGWEPKTRNKRGVPYRPRDMLV